MRLSTLLFLTLMSCVTFAQDDNFFEHPVGFKITKPDDWHFSSAAVAQAKLKNLKLKDESLQELLADAVFEPLVVLAKYETDTAVVNPTLKVELKPYNEYLQGLDGVGLMEAITPVFSQMFHNFKVVQPPTPVAIGGLTGASMTMKYILENTEEGDFPITSKLWIVPRGNYYFVIGAGVLQSEAKSFLAEVDSIIETVDLRI